MNANHGAARLVAGPHRSRSWTGSPTTAERSAPRTSFGGDERGVLSLEAVMLLPVLALLVVGLVQTATLLRDVLLVHEAARAGARAAATSTGTAAPVDAAERAAPELDLVVIVTPPERVDGDLASVSVTARRTLGPVEHTVRATAVARVEPAVRPGGLERATPAPYPTWRAPWGPGPIDPRPGPGGEPP
jgi:Flp pilus assembly protein TadG